jgi:hypothetical protein
MQVAIGHRRFVHKAGRLLAAVLVTITTSVVIVLAQASPALADPKCTNGVYVVFARGSGEHLNDQRANQLYLDFFPFNQTLQPYHPHPNYLAFLV